MEKIVLIGNGGHAKSIIDSIEAAAGYEIAGFIAAEEDRTIEYRGYKIVGTDNDLQEIYNSGIHNAFICIGYMGNGNVREKIYNKLKEIGFRIPTIIDPSAVIASDAEIGEGTYVGKKAVVNSAAKVGKMVIINTGAIVEHECVVGDFSHVAVAGVICGQATVGEKTFMGANATVIQGVKIGKECIVGAGAVIVKDVPDACAVVGVPGKTFR